MLLKFVIEGQILKRTDKNIPVANSKGYLRAFVDLPEEYKGTITLNVKRQVGDSWTNTAYTVDTETGLTNCLDDVLVDTSGKNFNLYFWLTCSNPELYVPTNMEMVRIITSEAGAMLPLIDKSINQYEETVLMYGEIKELSGMIAADAENTKEYADNAKTSEDNARVSEENARGYMETAIASANIAIHKAETATQKADTATQAASTATEKATVATNKAIEATQAANIASTKATEAAQSANIAKQNADKIDLKDKATSINYKLGIENGMIYLEEV
mgnify:CR=1 FL=1